jgi:predicted transcriptional regulator
MARRKTRTLTEVELEFMHVIWGRGEVTTEDVMSALQKQGRDLADGTVRKMLSILVEKGYLTRRRRGRGFLYKPRMDKDQATTNMVVDLLKRAFSGRASLMVAALIDSSAVRRKDIEEIKELIASHAQKGD